MTTSTATRSGWDGIVQRALLGTERTAASAAPAVPADLKALLDRLDGSDAEGAVLAAAAIVGSYEAAGRLPTRLPLPNVDAAIPESDDVPPAPARVGRFLATMLGGVNDDVLPEWLAAVSARGWRVPTPLLPALLDAGRKAPALREAIVPVLGARGRWLAWQNTDWSYAAGHAPPADAALRSAWETGTPDERSAILGYVRARDATLGRALLASTWAEEAPSQRATLLALLDRGLGPDDEPFLEQALDDRRQEVRRAAAQLLRRLAGSALVARMTGRAQTAVRWKPGRLLRRGEIIVEPPPDIDATMTRDGIEKKPPQGTGERAWWLAQIIAAVPPSVWSDTWSSPPAALVAAARAGDWGQPLTEGWAVAAVRHRDASWAEALLESGFPGEKPTSLAPQLDDLLGVLPIDRREAFIAKAIHDHPAADIAIALVAAADHAWSDSFSRAVVGWLRNRVKGSSKLSGAAEWRIRDLIPRVALRIPTSLAAATDGWPAGDDAGGLARALEQLITTLTFRRELAKELDR